ncbi:MAG: lamin tail domain-containing protein [Bacteroidota bacterium]
MNPILRTSVLIVLYLINSLQIYADDIWIETFSSPEKGYWGGGSDLSGVFTWTLDASACSLLDVDDYIKTVTTNDGRMEARDIDNEAIWTSELIDISGYKNVVLSVETSETGPSINTNKYVKVFYKLDGGIETLFDTNGDNIGNWSSATATQSIGTASTVQIIVRINNPNSSDLSIFDNVSVTGDPDIPDTQAPEMISMVAGTANTLRLRFSESMDQTTAENILNYVVDNSVGNPFTAVLNVSNDSIIDLDFTNDFATGQNYQIDITAVQDLNGNLIKDTTVQFVYLPFILDEVFVINNNELTLDFSRDLNPGSASIIANYIVDNAIGSPATAVFQEDNSQVKLSFITDFPSDTELSIHIENLEDENNIVLETINIAFYWHNTLRYDLVINEIMADPIPAVSLPEYEYLEIYNKTDYTICLNNWNLIIGNKTKVFPLKNIQSDEYLLICSESARSELNVFGETLGLLGSTDLINAGKELALRTNLQLTIDTINYALDWYQDEDKDNGGWALERVDPENTCGRLNNWKASVDVLGGTPGRQNSVYQSNIDLTKPQLIDIKLLSSTEIELIFDEELHFMEVSDTLNYILDNSFNPSTAFLSGEEQNVIQVTFRDAFGIGEHSLKILNIEDLCSNSLGTFDTVFTYYPGYEFDIIINEIMLDVNPAPNVLPPVKYIEIYNPTDVNINLSGWSLLINEDLEYFTDIQLAAKSYLILTDKDDVSLFSNYGTVYGIFSEGNLGTLKGQISLFNSNNKLIEYLNYSSDWYGDNEKKSGGWSLERIDPLNYCGLNSNWLASDDYKGGTPGRTNSVFADNLDAGSFELLNIEILSSSKLLLQFSKNIKEEQVLNTNSYFVDNGPGNPMFANFPDTSRATIVLQFATQFTDAYVHTLSIENLLDFCENLLINPQKEFTYHLISSKVAYAESKNMVKIIFSEEVEIVTAQQTGNYLAEPDLGTPFKAYKHAKNTNEVYLEFDIPFENGAKYTIHIENVKDLNGNVIKSSELFFSYFEPNHNDLVLNEILFNPRSGGVDFVEIYNNSAYPIDLKHLKIAKRNDDGIVESVQDISKENSLFLSGNYLAMSSDTSQTKTDYPAISYERFVQLNSLPSYPDDEGTVVLLFHDSVVDDFSYSDDMHLALINDVNGVSLEKLDPDSETSDPQNWFSAAESVGFATPANRNSQFTKFSTENTDEILIEPEVFSPDNDGYNDRVFIRYKFDEQGYVGNVTIYNSNGQLVKRIANNELMAVEGSLSWDGLYENNRRADIGIYIVYFEVFNLQGTVKRFKKTCVVAAKLK